MIFVSSIGTEHPNKLKNNIILNKNQQNILNTKKLLNNIQISLIIT